MRALVGLVLVTIPFGALVASAEDPDCTVVTASAWPDMNFTTVCKNTNHTYGDGTQESSNDHLAHVSHGVEVDPAFDYAYAHADQGTWTYDDGENPRHEREYTHVGAGAFEGVRGLTGGGFHANVWQRDQTTIEDGEGACSGWIGRSTCVGAGGWWSVQGVTSAGVGVYYQQTYDESGACTEQAEIDLSLLLVFVPIVTQPAPCTTEMPWLYDEVAFRDLPPTPVLP